jgi:hypothetical protein
LVASGCSEPSRLTDRQVDELLRLPAETAQASRQLVEQDAKSRTEWLALHASMQAELAEIGRRQEQLEERRQELARQRRTDAVLAAAIQFGGAALLCLVPALITVLLLWPRQRDESEELCEYLVETLALQQDQAKRLEAKGG